MPKSGRGEMVQTVLGVKGAIDFREIMLGKERDFGLEKK